MGFFKSSPKEPPQPLPSLALHLGNHQDHIFKPNDTISGHIALNTPVPITPQAIEVSLWGNSKVWIRRSHSRSNSTTGSSSTDYHHYRDNAPLFTVTFNLLPEQRTLLTDQTYNFPFNFRVPQGTGFDRSDCYQNPQDDRWTTKPHDLPPTFFYGSRPDWPEMPDNAEISYGVTARLVCPGIGIGNGQIDPLAATAPIIFQPFNPHANPQGPLSVVRYTKPFTVQSSSLTGQDPSSIGFRKRMHDRFSSSTPKLDFEVGIEIPDLLTSGAEFKFRTTFGVVDKDDKVTHIPPIHFRIQKVELLDFTFFRAPRDWNARNTSSGDPRPSHYPPRPQSSYAKQEDTHYREKKTILNSLPESQIVELEEVPAGEKKEMVQAQQCEYWFAARIPGFTPPSFTSFAITRMYRVKVKLGVEIGEKKFAYETESHIRHLGGA